MKKIVQLTVFTLCLQANAQENRSFNGIGNNINNQNWGAAQSPFRNLVSNGFADLISEPGGQSRRNPRMISNAIGSQTQFIPNELGLSDFIWGWGQFIDHDVNLNDDNTLEPNNIPVPDCEPLFDPSCTGTKELRMFRSLSEPSSGTDLSNPRKHINEITSYIDGSGVYGSDINRANWLRLNIDGKLKVSESNLLPWNTIDGKFSSLIDNSAPFMVLDGMPLPERYFVGGDVRINEQPGLSAFHTLWVREHNRLCDELKVENSNWTDEELYQRARKIVGALIQVVTYEEFLPSMGVILNEYACYNGTVESSILNSFSAAAYRFGHTMVNGRLVRFDENGEDWSFGTVDLRDGFFNPLIIKDEGGIEPFLRGLAAQEHQMVDPLIMDDLRNFLFGPPGAGGVDLLSLNIARARERGIPDYNTLRQDLSLSPHANFSSLTSNADLLNSLSTVYENDINNVDPWIGFMSEDHLQNSIVGDGLDKMLRIQFEALRDGDRYYYENDPAFTADKIEELRNTRLSEVILRNTNIETLQENVFIAAARGPLAVEFFPFPEIKTFNLNAYPNPIQKHFDLIVETSRPTTAVLSIWNIGGQKIREEEITLTIGTNELSFELNDDVASGLYIISIKSKEGQGQLRLIKQ